MIPFEPKASPKTQVKLSKNYDLGTQLSSLTKTTNSRFRGATMSVQLSQTRKSFDFKGSNPELDREWVKSLFEGDDDRFEYLNKPTTLEPSAYCDTVKHVTNPFHKEARELQHFQEVENHLALRDALREKHKHDYWMPKIKQPLRARSKLIQSLKFNSPLNSPERKPFG